MALSKPQTTNTAATAEAPQEEQHLTEEGVQATAAAEPEQAEDTQPEVNETPEPETTTQVAERPQASAPAKATGGAQFEENMAASGFEGMTLGGLSFEQIRLPGEGQFLIGQEDEELGKEFECVIQSTRSRYVVRQSNEQEAEMFYSYDPKGKVNSEGLDMTDTLQEWAEDGYEKPVIKKYIEAMAIMVNDENREGMMVMLSIPPASVQKFSGFVAQQQFMKKLVPSQYITRCVVGKKVKNGNNSFFPWNFQNAGEAPELF